MAIEDTKVYKARNSQSITEGWIEVELGRLGGPARARIRVGLGRLYSDATAYIGTGCGPKIDCGSGLVGVLSCQAVVPFNCGACSRASESSGSLANASGSADG